MLSGNSFPEKRFGVAVFANAPATNPERIAYDIADIYLNFPEPTKTQPKAARDFPAAKLKVPECSPEQLAAYVGDYWSEELQVVYHVSVEIDYIERCTPEDSK